MADKTLTSETKERFTTTLDGGLLQKIKILAIYEKCPANILLEEAMTDLLKKYEGKKAKEKIKQKERQNSLFETE
jgi:tRNA A37 N6-isopentenylltransferase MiaA